MVEFLSIKRDLRIIYGLTYPYISQSKICKTIWQIFYYHSFTEYKESLGEMEYVGITRLLLEPRLLKVKAKNQLDLAISVISCDQKEVPHLQLKRYSLSLAIQTLFQIQFEQNRRNLRYLMLRLRKKRR